MEKRNSLFGKANNKIPTDVENISICCLEDDTDDFMFTDGECNPGKSIATFSLRKLNELKAKHPDLNVYLNTI